MQKISPLCIVGRRRIGAKVMTQIYVVGENWQYMVVKQLFISRKF